MFFIRWIRYLFGNVSFSADGGFPEKFLNLAARSGIRMWNIHRRGTVLYASVLRRKFRRLSGPAEHAGVTLTVLSQTGVPFRIHPYRKRAGIAVGILVFFLIIWFFSSFVWNVEIQGNSKISTQEITDTLSDMGLRPGAFPLLLNSKEIEQQALLKLPGLSWMHIDLRGSKVVVKVKERIYPPEIVPADYPCNIKAIQTGVIVKLEAYQGVAMLKNGDTITKGGLLVSGVIDCKNGVVRFIHAKAKAIARVDHDLQVTVPFRQNVDIPTGKMVKHKTLQIVSLSIPLYFKNPSGNYQRSSYDSSPTLFGVRLPVGVTTTVFTQMKKTGVTLTKEQAAQMAKKLIGGKESTDLSSCIIKSRKYESKVDSKGYTLTGRYVCEEDIGTEEEIQIS